MASQETAVLNKIMIAASKKGKRLFRNHRGGAWMGKSKRMPNGDVLVYRAQFHRFGVGMNGGSDLIGFEPILITQEMVGKFIAQFQGYEVKAEGKLHTVSKEQQDFIDAVNALGGYAKAIDNADDI